MSPELAAVLNRVTSTIRDTDWRPHQDLDILTEDDFTLEEEARVYRHARRMLNYCGGKHVRIRMQRRTMA